jgi:hypothetical protein
MHWPARCPVFKTVKPKNDPHGVIQPDFVVAVEVEKVKLIGHFWAIECVRVDNANACWWEPWRLVPLTPAAEEFLSSVRRA